MKATAFLNRISENRSLVLAVVFILFGALHLHISLFDHYLCKTNTYDLAVYNFAFFDFAHLRVSPCPLYHSEGDIHFLQDHFSLTLPILSPLYWVMSPLFGTYTLLIIQWLLIVAGAYATYRLILLKSANFNLSIAAVLFYFTIYCRFAAYNADCNLVIMGSALLPVFFYFFEARKWVPMVLVFLALLVNREDFPLGLMFFCWMLLILHWRDKQKRKIALWLIVASIASFVTIFGWIIPALETPNKPYNLFNYNALGQGPKEALVFIVSHPLQALELLFKNSTNDPMYDGVKLKFYFVFLLSGGFVLFYRPVYLIAFIPLVAKKMWNDDPSRWSHEFYQGVEIATIFPAFVFLTLASIKKEQLRKLLAGLVCVLTIEVTLHQLYHSPRVYYGINRSNVFSGDLYTMTPNTRDIRELMRKIPDTSAVCASGHIAPQLAFRRYIYLFPRIENSRYVLLEKKGSTFPLNDEQYEMEYQKLLASGQWLTIYDRPGVILLRRK